MADRLLALRTFVRAAHSGSFSRAARELGLSQPSVSRILAGLEKEVGAALLVRTTRAVTLTDVGADYLSRTEPLLAALEEADHAARGTGELRGALRIALSSSFGVREVIPRLPAFLERHPALRIDLDINDGRQDLIADGVDVALRIGPMPDSSALARKLAEAARLLLASPSYLQRFDRPQAPSDLARHAVIIGPGPPGRGNSPRTADAFRFALRAGCGRRAMKAPPPPRLLALASYERRFGAAARSSNAARSCACSRIG